MRSKKVVLGYLPASLEYPYNVAAANGFAAGAREVGASVKMIDPRGSVEKQANAFDDLIAQGVNGIAMIPLDGVVAQSWVDKAWDLRTPVVSAATQVGDAERRQWSHVYPRLSALVGLDNTVAGKLAGELAATLLPRDREARIAIIQGAPGYPQIWQSTEGFEQALKALHKPYRIVAMQPTDWTPEKGQAVCQNFLSAHPDLDLIFSQADDMAIGCARAIRAASSSVRLVAMGGGSELGVRAIEEGGLDGSVCARPFETGRLAAHALYEAVTNKATATARLIGYRSEAITRSNLSSCPERW
jgi:ribose transport system substrate-binding protein